LFEEARNIFFLSHEGLLGKTYGIILKQQRKKARLNQNKDLLLCNVVEKKWGKKYRKVIGQ